MILIVSGCAGGWQGSTPSQTQNPANATTITQPQNQTVTVGQTATFSVTATGAGPYTYQWYKDGVAVSGATSSTYTTPATAMGDTGSVFTVTVTNTSGTLTSSAATLTVRAIAPSITLQPVIQTVNAGQAATFNVAATGTGPLTYQWYKNGVAVNGATLSSYTTPATATGDSGAIYTVKVSNSAGSVTSVNARLVVTNNPVILNTQPAGQKVCSGGVLTLSVNASFALSYQWKRNGTDIPGATNSTYSVSGATSANSGDYTVVVTNGFGSVTSSVATVVVGSAITSNPADLSIFATQTATFAVAAAGQSPFTYQWFQVPSGGSTGTALLGATSNVYTTPATDSTYNGAKYYATVSDSCAGPLTSTAANLAVTVGNVPPTIITQPVGQTVSAGGTTSFSVTASGTPSLSYQWYVIPAGQVTGTLISGAISATYNVPASSTATINDQDAYYVIVKNTYGQAVSQLAPLAVGNGILLQISGQPADQYVDEGAPATFTVTATSTLPLTYQWFRADPGSSTFTPIPGATSANYTFDPTALADSGAVYHVVVSNGTSSPVTSNSAALFVGPTAGIDNFCSASWVAQGNAVAQSGCKFQLTDSLNNQRGAIVWPTLVATANIQFAFTVTISNPSNPPADGFAVVLGDPSLGATPTSVGTQGQGLAAEGIPGFIFAFDTYHNAGEPNVPYFAIGRGEAGLFENPWFGVNTAISALASVGNTIAHDYTVSIVQGKMTVTLDGSQVYTGDVTVPPVAYFYVTSSTGGSFETTVISNLLATVSAPSE